jgi:hypothetical protein
MEIGSGIGTMIERLIEREMFLSPTQLSALDPDTENFQAAMQRLRRFAAANHITEIAAAKNEVSLDIPGKPLVINFQTVGIEAYARAYRGPGRFDLIIANAVLDLLNLPTALPQILSVAKVDCLFYFTINFDGASIFEPQIDPEMDPLIEELYHQTMDERVTDGQPSGDRYTGRHLFGHLRQHGIEILAAGSSDWVVFAGPDGYAGDEAYFLHFIIHTVHTALQFHPGLDQKRFADWIETRHQQIERGELVYIAHQIDFLGRR